MFSERLDKLIQSSLQDGVLTDQEKAVILKRAKAEGEDIDEVEIYIDSLLQKRQKELNNTAVKKQANASNMNELKKLIDAAMTDGVITPNERTVILNKAVALGIDASEAEIYLDAEIQKLDMETDAAVRRQKGKSCPHCGAYVSQLTDKCPECGQYITPEATKELEDILDNLEEALINMKARKDVERSKATVERYARKARMYYSNHPKIKVLLAEIDADVQETENRLKSEERKEAVTSLLKNSYFIGSLIIIIGFLILFLSFPNEAERCYGKETSYVGIAFGVTCIIGGIARIFGKEKVLDFLKSDMGRYIIGLLGFILFYFAMYKIIMMISGEGN